MADLVVKSKVKEHVQGLGLRTSSEALDQLSGVVAGILKKAGERCKANGRSTIKGADL